MVRCLGLGVSVSIVYMLYLLCVMTNDTFLITSGDSMNVLKGFY